MGMGMGIFLFELSNLVRGGGTWKNGSGDEGIGIVSGKEVEVEVERVCNLYLWTQTNANADRSIPPSLPSPFPPTEKPKTQNPKAPVTPRNKPPRLK